MVTTRNKLIDKRLYITHAKYVLHIKVEIPHHNLLQQLPNIFFLFNVIQSEE